ncbi:Type IV leader peptidase family protein [compost metagenome]
MIVLFLGLCLVIAVYDILFRRVPNSVLLLALFVHIGWLLVTGQGIGGVDAQQSLLGAGVGLAIFIPLYAMRAMGAGDVKFIAVLGALLGLKYLAIAWLIGSFLAGLHAIVFYSAHVWMAALPSGMLHAMQDMADSSACQRVMRARQGRKGIPYAAYLAIGAAVTLLWI